ncbi:BTAD domain-containing putative transcriptional regulator [Dactylosporangium sp. NPDC049525]|uniref:BTAD domain-containing putative transcriptional regulator n=1 Tax=Dactylosporangium sp. NPDC049525 TaxID=3154730 RepID=UPI0034167572
MIDPLSTAAQAPRLVRARVRAPQPQGLRRRRLVQPLVGPAAPQLTLIVAPAGAGKSTLLGHVAEAAGGPVAWLTLRPDDGGPGPVLAQLRAAFAGAVPGLAEQWPTADAALADLDALLTVPVLLVIDDLHSAREPVLRVAVEPFIEYQPDLLRIALGSRCTPDLDVTRRRLAGSMVELDADALRFRTWEVDELFRGCHAVVLRPREVTELTRRTAGWAAGLQLFHLATRRQPASTRAELLAGQRAGSRLTQEYLTRHVLDRVGDDVRDFLVATSVLDELTARRCDQLLGRDDSAARLVELERNGLFTFAEIDGQVFRYHDVLRAHLLDELAVRHGRRHARDLHRRAGQLLEAEGALTAAVRAYCRAESWQDVRRLLATGGPTLASAPGPWVDLLPESIRDQDPWVLLALGRRLLAEGALERAAEMYQRAVDGLGPVSGARAETELRRLRAWMRPAPGVVSDWASVARGLLSDPRRHLPAVPADGTATAGLLQAAGQLLAGELTAARATLAALDEHGPLTPAVQVGALLGEAIAAVLSGASDAESLVYEQLTAATKRLDMPLATRLAHGLQAIAAADLDTVRYIEGECRQAEDPWGGAVLRLLAEVAALGLVGAGDARVAALAELAGRFDALAAPALAAWAAAAGAAAGAIAGQPPDRDRLAAIEVAARALGPLPYALTLLATDPTGGAGEPAGGAARARELAVRIAEQCGAGALVAAIADRLSGPADVGARGGGLQGGLRVRCFGAFRVEADGAELDLAALRPRHQELLRLLALNANRTVHREQIVEWLWPGRAAERGLHSLQVAVSDLRKLLEPDTQRGDWARLRREHAGYRLVLDADEDCDVRGIDDQLRQARRAAQQGDPGAAVAALDVALALHTGELLPDDGAADWVVPERDRLHGDLADACDVVAGALAGAGGHAEAARLARLGLVHDRYRDGLWRRLIASLQESGNPAEATTAEAAYRTMLAELAV